MDWRIYKPPSQEDAVRFEFRRVSAVHGVVMNGSEPSTGPSRDQASVFLEHGVSVVIPCYHSEGSLPVLVEHLLLELRKLGGAFEILLVNDGSTDNTWKVIEELSRTHDEVCGLDLMRNYGQHNATLCGIRRARFELVMTMDDDLQHPPDEIPKLFEALTPEVDVLYATPLKHPHGLLRNFASRVTKLALKSAMGARTAQSVSAWRLFRTDLRDAFVDYRGTFVSIDVLLTWGTRRFSSVSVRHAPRTIGESNYTFGKLLTHAANMMTGFSTLPLQVASMIGFALTGFGALVLVFVMGRYWLAGGSVPGFPFLACLISIFSGAQLLCLGIIGEYLGRAHFRLLNRPAYVVRGQLWRGDDDGHSSV